MEIDDTFHVAAFAYDKRRELYFRIVKTPDINGTMRTVRLPFGISGEGVFDLFSRNGINTPLTSAEKIAVLRRIQSQNPKRRVFATAQVGWHNAGGGLVYVHPNRKFGPAAKKFHFVPESPARFAKYGQAGTLSSWRENVAAPATGNNLIMFVIMAAFAGPLMRLLNIETGGFQIVARSSTGKSTSLIAGGSVWGGGVSGFVETWLLTANALDLLAAAHCDGFLPLDEAGLASENKPSDAANLILKSVYRLNGEEEKIRFTDAGPRGTWRLLFVGTSELTLDQLAVRAGQLVDPGQRVRFPDIVFDGGKGMGVFEELHSAATPQRFADTLKDAAMQHYGTASIVFLKKLTEERGDNRDGLKKWLERRMEYYTSKKAAVSGWDGMEARVARRFALVYAAGCLAQEYGILPWDRKDMAAAVQRCHKCVPHELYHPPLSGAEHVAKYIRSKRTRFIDLETFDGAMTKKEVLEAPGLIYTRQNGQREYLFSSQQFRKTVCAGLTSKSVIADLKSKGLINLHNSGKSTIQRTIPGFDPERVVSIRGEIVDTDGKGSQSSNQRKQK